MTVFCAFRAFPTIPLNTSKTKGLRGCSRVPVQHACNMEILKNGR